MDYKEKHTIHPIDPCKETKMPTLGSSIIRVRFYTVNVQVVHSSFFMTFYAPSFP